MDWFTGMQRAIDYIEDNIASELDYQQIAAKAYSSSYHFQRTFSVLTGYTLGEYIRYRRLTLAGVDMMATNEKVIDIAAKYGYESPDSFSRAFCKFHGITPSAAREPGAVLRSFAPLKIVLEGGNTMNYRIETKPAMTFIGHKQRCSGAPTNPEVKKRETFVHWTTSRSYQRTMKSLLREPNVWYDVYTDFTDEGFDHYIAVISDQNMAFGLEQISVQESLYAVFETEHQESPDEQWLPLMKRIVSEWLPSSGYILAEKPQINRVVMAEKTTERYMEIWIPIEKG